MGGWPIAIYPPRRIAVSRPRDIAVSRFSVLSRFDPSSMGVERNSVSGWGGSSEGQGSYPRRLEIALEAAVDIAIEIAKPPVK